MPLPICHEPKYKEQLDKFLRDWPISRVRTMPLTDYSRINNDTDESFRGSFCYALEHETPLGIGGGNALKFGVYEFRKPTKMQNALQDTRYAWDAELGKTAEDAYAKLRSQIIEVIEAAQAGEYAKLDSSPLRRALKWKIAFLYQNQDRPGIVGCVVEDALRDYFKEKVPGVDAMPVSQLHALAIEKGPERLCLNRVGWALWDAVKAEETEPTEDEPDEATTPNRGYWNFSYGQDDADGINDFETLLRTGEIRADWLTTVSLANLSADKDQGKADALELLDTEDQAEETKEAGRRPSFNFYHMGIPKGAILCYAADPTKSVEVIDERRVKFEGEEVSMTDVTQRLRGTSYYIGPMPHWTYKGEKLSNYYNRTYPSRKPTGTALMCWLFAKKMKVGDVVFARQSKTQDYIAGLVVSDYQFDTNRETYQHYRKVQWLTTNKVHVARAADIITKALTDISYGNWLSYVDEIAGKLGIDLEALPPVPAATVMPNNPTMIKPTNVILYGPPGTGKTFHTKEHAVTLCNGKATPATLKEDFAKLVADKRVAFVTFHQSYDYSDFIIGFKPVPSASGMSFEVRKGVLMRLAEKAENNPQLPYLLIIDEINRGNISKIFGELITLIEADKRRDGDFPLEVTLPCAFKGADGKETCQFSLPSNVHLLGTMNTADRSIALLDTALRRRFKFVRKEPKPDLLHADLDGVKLPKLLTKLNEILVEAFSPDHQIGHAWLPMKFDAKATAKDLVDAFNDKILPLLDEWYYDNADAKKELIAQLTEDDKVTLVALKKFSES
jgi:hypothetical protein